MRRIAYILALLVASASSAGAQACQNNSTLLTWTANGSCTIGGTTLTFLTVSTGHDLPISYRMGNGFFDVTIRGGLADSDNRVPQDHARYAGLFGNRLIMDFQVSQDVTAIGLTKYVGQTWGLDPASLEGWDFNSNWVEMYDDAFNGLGMGSAGFCPYGSIGCNGLDPLIPHYRTSSSGQLTSIASRRPQWMRLDMSNVAGVSSSYGPRTFSTVTGIEEVTFRVALVPEPSTYAFLSVGLLVLGVLGRRGHTRLNRSAVADGE